MDLWNLFAIPLGLALAVRFTFWIRATRGIRATCHMRDTGVGVASFGWACALIAGIPIAVFLGEEAWIILMLLLPSSLVVFCGTCQHLWDRSPLGARERARYTPFDDIVNELPHRNTSPLGYRKSWMRLSKSTERDGSA